MTSEVRFTQQIGPRSLFGEE